MCVRYTKIETPEGGSHETGDLFPGEVGAFSKEGGELVEARWGLQPFWAKDASFGRKNAYNARSETLAEKPTFRTALRQRRCVIPAAAFYERAEGRWLRVSPARGEPFLFAGLWEPENERTEGLPTYTMVTTVPNERVEEVHDRMPVVLSPDDAEAWMSPGVELDRLRALLVPCPPDWTRIEDAGPISRKKGSGEPSLF